MFPEELEGKSGVCDYRSALLLDCFVYGSRAFDVARLSFAYSEDLRDALYAVDKAGLSGFAVLTSCEGFLDRLVDYLSELRHGEVDDACVWIHVVLYFSLFGPQGRSRTFQAVGRRVSDFARRGLTPAAAWGWCGAVGGPAVFLCFCCSASHDVG